MQLKQSLLAAICCVLGVMSPWVISAELKLVTRNVLSRYENRAFALMKQSYQRYLTLQGHCQLRPQRPRCQQEFRQARTRYMATKANWDVMQLLQDTQQYRLSLSPTTYPALQQALLELGYCRRCNKVNEQGLIEAAAYWSVSKGLPKTDELYLLHWVLIQTDWYAMQMGS